MKKFAKVCGIIIGSCMVLGLILCGIAVLVGGKTIVYQVSDYGGFNKAMVHMANKIQILDKTYINLDDSESLQDNSEDNYDYSYDCEEDYEDDFDSDFMNFDESWDEAWSNSSWGIYGNPKDLYVNGALVSTGNKDVIIAEEVDNFSFLLGAGEFKIRETQENQISLNIEGKGNVEYSVENGTLFVKGFYRDEDYVSIGNSNSTIVINIPKTIICDKIKVQLGAGTLNANNINAKSIDMQVGAGTLEFSDVTADEIEAKLGAGEVTLNDLNIKDLDIDIALGSCTIEGVVSGNMDVQCAMGNLDASLRDSEENHNYSLFCTAGNISLGNREFSGLATDKTIDNNSESTYKFNCKMGEIAIDFQ